MIKQLNGPIAIPSLKRIDPLLEEVMAIIHITYTRQPMIQTSLGDRKGNTERRQIASHRPSQIVDSEMLIDAGITAEGILRACGGQTSYETTTIP